MLSTAAKKNKRSFFNVHRRELIIQSVKAFEKVGVSPGVISSGFKPNIPLNIQVASVQSLPSRMSDYQKPDLIIWDECHHIAASTWEKIFNYYKDSFHIGLSATPERADGKGLNKFFNVMIKGPSVKWLIENKFLSDYKLYAPANVDLTGVRKSMGDYNKTQLEEIMDKPTITGSAIKEYLKIANKKKAVVFCVSVEHSKHVVEQFNSCGVKAAHLDGSDSKDHRDNILKQFAFGKIDVLSNVDLFSEGFDIPSIECVILLRPTYSLPLYLQQVGRSLRPSPGKTHAIILDHVGNVQRHGLPDEDRNWSLLGKKGRLGTGKSDKNTSVKICPSCFAAQEPGLPNCIYCKVEFEKSPREIAQIEGELLEINKEQMRLKARRQQGMAKTMDELIALGKQKGYKKPYYWAKMVFNRRQANKIKGKQ